MRSTEKGERERERERESEREETLFDCVEIFRRLARRAD